MFWLHINVHLKMYNIFNLKILGLTILYYTYVSLRF